MLDFYKKDKNEENLMSMPQSHTNMVVRLILIKYKKHYSQSSQVPSSEEWLDFPDEGK